MSFGQVQFITVPPIFFHDNFPSQTSRRSGNVIPGYTAADQDDGTLIHSFWSTLRVMITGSGQDKPLTSIVSDTENLLLLYFTLFNYPSREVTAYIINHLWHILF